MPLPSSTCCTPSMWIIAGSLWGCEGGKLWLWALCAINLIIFVRFGSGLAVALISKGFRSVYSKIAPKMFVLCMTVQVFYLLSNAGLGLLTLMPRGCMLELCNMFFALAMVSVQWFALCWGKLSHRTVARLASPHLPP